MQILAPLNSLKNLDRLIALGADEFYLGFEDAEWNKRFGQYHELNKMSSIKGSDISAWEDLPRVIETVKKTGKPCFVTINGFSYTNEQIEFFDKRFRVMADIGVDGIILGAPELFGIARQYHLAVHASSMCNVYNELLVDYYREQGAKRIILPRDLPLKDIGALKHYAPDMEFEVFLMRVGCRYSDPNCLCLHGGKYGGICGYLNRSERVLYSRRTSFEEKHDFSVTNDLYERMFHVYPACGLCAIYDLVAAGIDACKIVGRYENTDEVAEDVRLIRLNIDVAKHSGNREEFLDNMTTHTLHRERCYLSLGCYYPEARF